MMTTTNTATTGTCQLCERECKLVRGKISLHGYKRPGHGWIDGSCWGSKEVQWSEGFDVVTRYVEMLSARVAQLRETVARYSNPELAEVKVHNVRERTTTTYVRGQRYPFNGLSCDMFAITVANRLRDAEDEIKRAEREIARQNARIAAR